MTWIFYGILGYFELDSLVTLQPLMLPTTWEDDPEITKAFVMAPSTELA